MSREIPLVIRVERLHPDARLPTKAHAGDAGWDLYAVADIDIRRDEARQVPIGIAVEIPPGWYAQVQDRSSWASLGLVVAGGVIDRGYRGEVRVVVVNAGLHDLAIAAGERIAQFVLHPVPEIIILECDKLSETDRGSAGFGSTGK